MNRDRTDEWGVTYSANGRTIKFVNNRFNDCEHIEYGIVSAHEGFEGIECHAKGYHVENDALICDENQELLCCWSRQKHYTVPECVKRIAEMGGNPFVETITVKQPVELTTYDFFASNINLRNVDFQGGVTGINNGTFYNCPKLEINY